MLQVGEPFPAFELFDQDGNTHSLKSAAGRPFVLFCYPKDSTPGCTIEACQFRDSLELQKIVQLLGISPDPVKSHQKFAAAHALTFPLLSDPDKLLLSAIGAWGQKSLYGKKYFGVLRTTFLVDARGQVAHVWEKVKPLGHASKVLSLVREKLTPARGVIG